MTPQIEIMLIASVVSVACALPGVFLILRGVALMSDAISHAVLLGIVLSFFVVKDLASPWLLVGATIAGLLTVVLTEMIIQTKRLKEDAAIGFVFPVFFSLGVILISRYAGDIHLDTDAVLLGELAFAPFNRLVLFGIDMMPHALGIMSLILFLNSLFVAIFYKELKLASFDSGLARSLGYSPALIHYSLMTLTSVTAVGAFDAVGSILVVALMITPPSAAYLLSRRLPQMLGLSIVFALVSALGGYQLARVLDASIAGSMATMTGIIFVLTLFFAPERGLVSKAMQWKHNRLRFAGQMLSVQLLSHEGTKSEREENTMHNIVDHMDWSQTFANQVTRRMVQEGYLSREQDLLRLTSLGREMAKETMVRI